MRLEIEQQSTHAFVIQADIYQSQLCSLKGQVENRWHHFSPLCDYLPIPQYPSCRGCILLRRLSMRMYEQIPGIDCYRLQDFHNMKALSILTASTRAPSLSIPRGNQRLHNYITKAVQASIRLAHWASRRSRRLITATTKVSRESGQRRCYSDVSGQQAKHS